MRSPALFVESDSHALNDGAPAAASPADSARLWQMASAWPRDENSLGTA